MTETSRPSWLEVRDQQNTQNMTGNGKWPRHKLMRLKVYVSHDDAMFLPLTLTGSATLGRSDAENGFVADLDLSPFDAQDAGVSRRHAQFVLHDGLLFLCDLGSVNGTSVNGATVPANHAVPVRSGDSIELGQLRLIVKIESVE